MEVKSESPNEVHLQVPQESIGFEATITATSSPFLNKYAKLTVPIWFVREHGRKMQESVKLLSRATGRTWTVQVVVYHPQRSPQVMFTGGWSAFASFNCLAEGDRVTFTLLSMSEFEVGISRCPGIKFPCISRSKKVKSSQNVTEIESPVCEVEGIAAEERKKPLLMSCEQPIAEAESTVIQVADPASKNVSHRNPCFSKSHFLTPKIETDTAFESSHISDMRTEPPPPEVETSFTMRDTPRVSIELKRGHGHEYKGDANAPRKKLQISPPRFFKKLSRSNCSMLEIPSTFARTYGIQLDKSVTLRWIDGDSPVFNVACTWRLDRDRMRISLTNGWKEFKSKNDLQLGQELEFTLIAESSFVVRPRLP